MKRLRSLVIPLTTIVYSLLFCTVPLRPVRADEAEYLKIRAGMSKLAPLVGKWHAKWWFHDKDGVTEEVGSHSISWVLDGTYLQIEVERHHKDNPERRFSHLNFITFNP